MRGFFFAALAVTVLASGSVVTAIDESKPSTEIHSVADSISTQESSKRLLRVVEPDDADDLFAEEERAKGSELAKLAKQLKLRNMPQKKLAIAISKAKGTINKLPTYSVANKKFLRLFNKGLSVGKAAKQGLIKGAEIGKYERFFELATRAKARNPAAFKAK